MAHRIQFPSDLEIFNYNSLSLEFAGLGLDCCLFLGTTTPLIRTTIYPPSFEDNPSFTTEHSCSTSSIAQPIIYQLIPENYTTLRSTKTRLSGNPALRLELLF